MEKNKVFKKFQSFQELKISKNSSLKKILEKIYRIFKENSEKLDNFFSTENQKLLKIVLDDLFSENKKSDFCFTFKENSIAELNTFENLDVLKYLIHRYRYEIYPQKNYR